MLLIGYGNPGRGDDGLGPALSEAIAARDLAGLDVDTDYQLVAEHVLAIADHDLVIFADAEMEGTEQFSFREISSGSPEVLGSHSLVPETVLALCETLYGAKPRAFVLGISGYDYGDVKEGLSEKAAANLSVAEMFLVSWIAKQVGPKETAHA
ncbi:MAG: hydrogenase maturation protease [Roseibium sp.]